MTAWTSLCVSQDRQRRDGGGKKCDFLLSYWSTEDALHLASFIPPALENFFFFFPLQQLQFSTCSINLEFYYSLSYLEPFEFEIKVPGVIAFLISLMFSVTSNIMLHCSLQSLLEAFSRPQILRFAYLLFV